MESSQFVDVFDSFIDIDEDLKIPSDKGGVGGGPAIGHQTSNSETSLLENQNAVVIKVEHEGKVIENITLPIDLLGNVLTLNHQTSSLVSSSCASSNERKSKIGRSEC